MKTMTVKELKNIVNNLDSRYDDMPLLYPVYEDGFPDNPVNFYTVNQCGIIENNATPDLGLAFNCNTKVDMVKALKDSDFLVHETLYPEKRKLIKRKTINDLCADGTLSLLNDVFEVYDSDFELGNGDDLCISDSLLGNLPFDNCIVTHIGINDDPYCRFAIYVDTRPIRKELNMIGKDWIEMFNKEKEYFKKGEMSKEFGDLFRDRIC